MQPIRLFLYDQYVKAVVVLGYEGTENMPITNTKLKAYKGSNQTIKFGIFDSDGKPFSEDSDIFPADLKLSMIVIDKRENREVIYKDLELSTPSTIPNRRTQTFRRPVTYFECELLRGDLEDLNAHTPYEYVIYQRDDNDIQSGYLYTDIDYGVPGEFVLLDNASAQFTPSIDTNSNDNWNLISPSLGSGYENMDHIIVGSQAEAISNGWALYTSSVYPADGQLGYFDMLHTAAVYANNLTGVLKISGSLANNVPPLDYNQWFPIADSNGVVYHNFTEDSDIRLLNFSGNFTWIRFDLYIKSFPDPIPAPPPNYPDQGSIEKILYRH